MRRVFLCQRLTLLLAVLAQFWLPPAAKAFILAPDTRWTSTATNASTGTYGQPITLTWSLVPDGTPISNGYDHLTSTSALVSTFDAAFGAGPSGTDLTQRPWFHLFSDSFNRWNQLGGINFVYEPHDTSLTLGSSTPGALTIRGDIRIGAANIDGASNTLAETLLPQVGDILIDTADMSFFKQNDATNVAEGYLFAVHRPCRRVVVDRVRRQLSNARAVGVHDEQRPLRLSAIRARECDQPPIR